MKGKNAISRKHSFSTAGGPGSKRKANAYGTAHRAAKYAAQWARTAANKKRRIARQIERDWGVRRG